MKDKKNEWEVTLDKLKKITFQIEKAFNNRAKVGITTYQMVEKLLWGYPILDTEIRDLNEQIERFTKHPEEFDYAYARKSKDVARFSSCLTMPVEITGEFERAIELLDEKKRNFERLIESVKKIEHDEYFEIIELCYFQGKSEMETAKILDINQGTVNRNRKRLVQQLEWIVFGMKCIEK